MRRNIGLGYFQEYFGTNNGMKINDTSELGNKHYPLLSNLIQNGTSSFELKLEPAYSTVNKIKKAFYEHSLDYQFHIST